MTRTQIVLASLALVVGASCAHQPQPYSFTVSQRKTAPDALDVLVATLASNGHSDVEVDRTAGTITTRWFDTGYKFRELSEADNGPLREYPTNIFLRYRIAVTRQTDKQTVTIHTNVQRCSSVDSVVTSKGVEGSCAPLDVLPPSQQQRTDDLGAKLQAALVSGSAGA